MTFLLFVEAWKIHRCTSLVATSICSALIFRALVSVAEIGSVLLIDGQQSGCGHHK
jgi:hypothetical protein